MYQFNHLVADFFFLLIINSFASLSSPALILKVMVGENFLNFCHAHLILATTGVHCQVCFNLCSQHIVQVSKLSQVKNMLDSTWSRWGDTVRYFAKIKGLEDEVLRKMFGLELCFWVLTVYNFNTWFHVISKLFRLHVFNKFLFSCGSRVQFVLCELIYLSCEFLLHVCIHVNITVNSETDCCEARGVTLAWNIIVKYYVL